MLIIRWQSFVLGAIALCSIIVVTTGTVPVMAQVLETDALLRKQEDQQRARTLTRDLLGGVLDVQLRQLEENGLSDQEIYRDIKLMRQNLNHLVETEMSKVVDLLSVAQRLPKEKREAAFVEARQQIRTIVRQLAIERQNLLKRLKIAELAEQARRLIRHETVVQTATKGLPAEPQTRQESLTLKAIEDQRDVKELFLQLVETMVDMKSWSGLLASTAADGLRILKAAEVGKHLDAAGRDLQGVKYESACDEQELVLKGLRELLKVIERAQGSLNSDKLAALDRLRALSDQQKQLRDETKKLPENQQPSAEMVERQSQVQKEIVQLQDVIQNNLKSETHLQQAEAAALDAAANMLDNKLDQALADQGRVLGNLAALELALKEQARDESRNKSADELAQTVKVLAKTKAALSQAKLQQDAAEEKAAEDAHSAAAIEKGVAEIVHSIDEKFELSASLETALADATNAANEATKNLESAQPAKATAVEEKALEKAHNALDRAINAVDAALTESKRLESAVKIGELARAAEVLERAAAEERAIAKDATSLAQANNADKPEMADKSKDLANRQGDVKAIAEKAAEAIAQTAPQAATSTAQAAQSANDSKTSLQAVADQQSAEPHASLKQAADAAAVASQKLAEAAKEIRREIVATAKELSQRTAEQAEKLAEARRDVEDTIDHLPSSDQVEQLHAAKNKLGDAMRQQARAQGKPEAAAAMELTDQIANAIDAQDAASVAAIAADSGTGSDLKATTKQEEVAERSQSAVESAMKRPQTESLKKQGASDPLTQALNDAQQAASQAAKQTLDGNPVAAEASRKAADESLKKAMTLAQAESAAAARAAPTSPLDHEAQTKAAAEAVAAQKLAAKASSAAEQVVAPASAAAQAADQTLSTNSDQAPAAQAKSAAELQAADQKLAAAIQKAAQQRAKTLAQQAKDTTALGDRVAAADPAAADAIDQAARVAKMGSEAVESPRQMTDAASSAELALEHAAADLGAKEQEVKRDQAIAESVANLAQEQQTAAEMIAEQANDLEKLDAIKSDTNEPTSSQRKAAQKLNDAQQQFADSQRATGQGAVELSGQTQVANPPLREALEMASNLPTNEFPAAMLAATDSADGQLIPSEGQPLTDAKSTPAEQSANGDPTSTAAEGQTEPGSKGQAGPSTPASGKPNGLGTGFVPQSPQLTAEMMAGPTAQQAAQKALSQQQLPMNQQQSKNPSSQEGQTSNAQEDQSAAAENASSSKLTKKSGSAATNQKVKDGSIEKQREGTDAADNSANKSREKDDNIMARQLKEEAWFAKLPPELRKSIRAGAGQKPPRAYEERLKKYFQSVD